MNTPFKKDLILLSPRISRWRQAYFLGGLVQRKDRVWFWNWSWTLFFVGNNNFMEKRLLGGLDTLFTTLIYQLRHYWECTVIETSSPMINIGMYVCDLTISSQPLNSNLYTDHLWAFLKKGWEILSPVLWNSWKISSATFFSVASESFWRPVWAITLFAYSIVECNTHRSLCRKCARK